MWGKASSLVTVYQHAAFPSSKRSTIDTIDGKSRDYREQVYRNKLKVHHAGAAFSPATRFSNLTAKWHVNSSREAYLLYCIVKLKSSDIASPWRQNHMSDMSLYKSIHTYTGPPPPAANVAWYPDRPETPYPTPSHACLIISPCSYRVCIYSEVTQLKRSHDRALSLVPSLVFPRKSSVSGLVALAAALQLLQPFQRLREMISYTNVSCDIITRVHEQSY